MILDNTEDPEDHPLSQNQMENLLAAVDELKLVNQHRYNEISDTSDIIVKQASEDIFSVAVKFPSAVEFSPSYPPVVATVNYEDSLFGLSTVNDDDETITITGSIGEYYQAKHFDHTISQAFDIGFATAVKLLKEGLISLDDLQQ